MADSRNKLDFKPHKWKEGQLLLVSFKITSLLLGLPYGNPIASKATLKNMGKSC